MESGSRPITTAPWDAGTSFSAQDVNSGKPTTIPRAIAASRSHWRPVGTVARVISNTRAASPAATIARPRPTKVGSKSIIARRVAGNVRLKPATPSMPNATLRRLEGWEFKAAQTDGRSISRESYHYRLLILRHGRSHARTQSSPSSASSRGHGHAVSSRNRSR